jgi:hypothetical protein
MRQTLKFQWGWHHFDTLAFGNRSNQHGDRRDIKERQIDHDPAPSCALPAPTSPWRRLRGALVRLLALVRDHPKRPVTDNRRNLMRAASRFR